jgi:hypothetical protein
VNIAELYPAVEVAPREKVPDLSEIPPDLWIIANKRYEIIKPLVFDPDRTRVTVQRRARQFDCHVNTLYEWLAKYEANPQLSSLLPKQRIDAGSQKLGDQRETVVKTEIEAWLKTEEPKAIAELTVDINSLLKKAKLKVVHKNTVRSRIRSLSARKKAERSGGRKAANKLLPHRGKLKARFRCRWRVAFYTFCTTHKCMLQERCPECFSPVVFHRRELGRPRILNSKVLCLCSECDYDLRKAKPGPPTILESQSFRMFEEMLAELESGHDDPLHVCIEFTEVLHQICMLLVSGRPTLRLYDFVLSEMKVRHRALTKGRFPFEERALDERHFVIQLAMWLLANPADRLKQAWEAGAVRYNYLVKDMDSPSEAFAKIVAQFNRGRRVL